MEHLAGRVAWITGAASGIGLALAHRLAAEQVKLVLVDVEPLDEAAAALRDKGATVLPLCADVSSGEAMKGAVARALDAFGVVHLIANNAGIGGGAGPLWTLSEADWRRTIDVNLWGVVHGVRLLLPPLLESGEEGHVINTASMAGLTSPPAMGPYVATKHAVVALSECLAKELELLGSRVSVSVLCPGFVRTNIAAEEHATSLTHPMAQKLAATLKVLVDSGIPAEAVADQVVAAIRARTFYVLTHPEMKPAIEHRMRQILDGEQPGIDPLFRARLR